MSWPFLIPAMRMRRSLSVLLVLTACARCADAPPPEQDEPAAGAGTPAAVTMSAEQIAHGGVRWAATTEANVADFVELSGRLMVDEDHTARLSPSVRGRVIDVKANVGDAVSRGQVLVTLQSEEASARRADLASAAATLTERQSALNFARAGRERAERLLALKAGSALDLDRARTEEATAQAGLSQAQAAVDHARTSLSTLEVDPATGQVGLASPITGVVVARDAVAGSVVEAGASTLVVTNPSFLWLEFGASPDVARRLSPGQRIEFVAQGAGEVLHGRVLGAGGALDAATRLVVVRAAVENPARTLRPEMFATVRAATGPARPTVTLPPDAVQLVDEHPVAFVAQPNSSGGATFIRRGVDTGTTANDRTHIVSGLKAGDVVVTDGAFAVKSLFSRAKMPAGE